MRQITLTTVVRNQATLPILLRITDELVAAGALTSLRVVDLTIDDLGTERLRSMIPVDGSTDSRIVALDSDRLKYVDPSAYVSTGMTDYRYKATDFCLVAGGREVNIMTRGVRGSYIAISPDGKTSGGIEIGLEKSRCFVRTGRGGGTPIVSLDVSGIVAGGLGWRGVSLRVNSSDELLIELDTGVTMTTQLKLDGREFIVSVSAPSGGSSDFVVSYLSPKNFEHASFVDRAYVSYFTVLPKPVSEGIEVISDIDLVYIDKNGWQRLIDEKSIPLIFGDPACNPTLRRLGILKESTSSKQVHTSFLDRSRTITQRIEDLVCREIPTSIISAAKVKLYGGGPAMGFPALICGLHADVLQDVELLERYTALSVEGPRGDVILNKGDDVLAYFDILLNSAGADAFLLELAEAMPKDKKEFLIKILSERLS